VDELSAVLDNILGSKDFEDFAGLKGEGQTTQGQESSESGSKKMSALESLGFYDDNPDPVSIFDPKYTSSLFKDILDNGSNEEDEEECKEEQIVSDTAAKSCVSPNETDDWIDEYRAGVERYTAGLHEIGMEY